MAASTMASCKEALEVMLEEIEGTNLFVQEVMVHFNVQE